MGATVEHVEDVSGKCYTIGSAQRLFFHYLRLEF